MKIFFLTAVVLLVACGATTPTSAVTPTPTPAPSPTATPIPGGVMAGSWSGSLIPMDNTGSQPVTLSLHDLADGAFEGSITRTSGTYQVYGNVNSGSMTEYDEPGVTTIYGGRIDGNRFSGFYTLPSGQKGGFAFIKDNQ